ncbi:MAG: hypothetical protein ACRD3J_20395, partial [Thermoanaerobaculia bacterium]
VMPVARKVWQPIGVGIPASRARRRIICHACGCERGLSDSGRFGERDGVQETDRHIRVFPNSSYLDDHGRQHSERGHVDG